MRISGTDIYIAQGDSATLTLSFEKEQTGLKMWISSTKNSINGALQSQENLYHYKFEILSSHTAIEGEFFYDIFKTEESETTTIIRNSRFVVEPTARGKYTNQTTPQTSGSNP